MYFFVYNSFTTICLTVTQITMRYQLSGVIPCDSTKILTMVQNGIDICYHNKCINFPTAAEVHGLIRTEIFTQKIIIVVICYLEIISKTEEVKRGP